MTTSPSFGENLTREWSEEPRAQELKDGLQLIKSDSKAGLGALTKLAESGSSLAMMYLATIYLFGRPGISRNSELAEYWLQRSRSAGSIEGAFRLAWYLLENGRPEEGMQEFGHLAQLDFPPALFAIGWQYYKGKFFKRDLKKAIHYFKLAERNGHLQAANQLAHIMMRLEMGPMSWFFGLKKKISLMVPIFKTAIFDRNSDSLRGG
jgi:TPR repeat protein